MKSTKGSTNNNAMRTSKRRVFFLWLSVAVMALLWTGCGAAIASEPATGNTIIMMIGDGMGFKQVEATRNYMGGPLAMESLPVKYACTTYGYGGSYSSSQAWSDFNYVINGATGSAESATAIATGQRTSSGYISVNYNLTARLKTITEHAQEKGWGTGIVTTVRFSHATPGAFGAHNNSRSNYFAIAREMITTFGDGTGAWGNTPTVDVIIGAGHPAVADPDICISDAEYNALKNGTTGQGWTFVERQDGVNGTTQLLNAAATSNKLFGLFGSASVYDGDLPYRYADGHGIELENPTLADMTKAALMVLSKKPVGRFLMIEGGSIDHGGHENNIDKTIGEVIDFDLAVSEVLDWVTTNDPTWSRTLLIISADHETGYLTKGTGVFPNVPLGNPGAGIVPTRGVHIEWNTGGHTNSLVPLYAKGAGSQRFADHATSYDSGWQMNYMSHRNIFNVMLDYLSEPISDPEPPSVPTNLQATTLSSTSIGLTWTASTDNIAVAGYKIYINGDELATTTATSYISAGLTPGTTYSYTVSAYDYGQNESAQSSPPAVATTQSAPASSFRGLGDLAGGSYYSVANAVSADGTVVVGTSSSTSGFQAFRWTEAIGMVGLGDLPGGIFDSRAWGISGDGTMIVGNSTSTFVQPFRWTAAQGMVGMNDIEDPDLNDGNDGPSRAVAASYDGSVLFGFGQQGTKGRRGARWQQVNNYAAEEMIGMGRPAEAYAVTADGSVAVGYHTVNSVMTALRWINGTKYNLPDLAGGTAVCCAYGITPDASIIVGYGNDAAGKKAARWDAPSSYGVTPLKGATAGSEALGVSADGGFIVGQNSNVAFIWDEYNGIRSVKSVLESRGLDLTGWTLTRATAISNDGLTIVGWGTNPSGQQEAWHAVIGGMPDVEPPTVPTNVSAVALSHTSVMVNWSASTDNQGVAGYKIFCDGVVVGTSDTTTFTESNLRAGTSYTYTVSAFDARGNESGESAPAVATTPAGEEISAIKDLPSPSSIYLAEKYVTAVFNNYFYVGQTNRASGIRVVPTQMPGGLSVGSVVDVEGIIMISDQGERYIGDATVRS